MSPRRRRNHMIWIGLLVTVAGALSYFLFFVRFPPLRDFPWVNLPLVVLGLGLSTLGVWRAFLQPAVFRGRVFAPLGFAFSLLLATAFVFYIFWLSDLPEASDVARNLVRAPDFALASTDGETVRLSDFLGEKVVLVFYRGFW